MPTNIQSYCLFPLLTALFFSCSAGSDTEPPQPPNVIVLITDDQGYGDFSFTGNPVLQTPHLDHLYQNGVLLDNFHVDPTCAPTRAALLTGRYSARTGVWMTYMGRHHLAKEEVTMADIFAANGYRTGIFGKWHLGDNYPFRPSDRGFQESLVHGGGVIGETPDYWGNDYYDDIYLRNNKPEQAEGYCTDVWFREAEQFIKTTKDQPFFLYLATNAPHGPLNVPRQYVEPYLNNPDIPERMAWFYGMIASIDENVGQFTEFLQNEDLLENTVLITMTDNGTRDGYHPRTGKGFNAGMRALKASPYEGGHRVPLSIQWPAGGLTGGKIVDQLTAHLDVLPTLIDLLELKPPKAIEFDGTTLRPLLENTTSADWPERTLCVHNQISFGQKLDNDLPVKYKKYAVMTDRWRYVNGELYDIKTDPGQTTNLVAKEPEVVKQLHTAYDEWWADIGTQFDRYNATIVGREAQEKVVLSAQFWHGDHVPYSQEHVRSAMVANGFWDLDVAEAGTYQISLRRYPRESGQGLGGNVPPPAADSTQRFPLDKHYQYPSTIVRPVSARLKVGDFDETVPVSGTEQEVTFTVDLPAGLTFLQTWLATEERDTIGAYYVYVQ